MAMSIRTNVASLNAQAALFKAGNDLNTSMQRLSSGYRINSSADDAAGLAISTKMQSQISGLNQASSNAQDGISMIQTAEGALDEVQSNLQRMRDLSVQAANATLSDTDRGNINQEIQALFTNINNISNRTQFNGQSLLTGALTTSQDATTGGINSLVAGQAMTTAGGSAVTAVNVSNAIAGTAYTLSTTATAGVVAMSATINGVATTQNVTVADMAAGGTQTLDFSSFGIKISLGASGTATGANLATDLTAATNNTITTVAGTGTAQFQVGANANQTQSAAFFNTTISSTNNTGLNTAISAFNTATPTIAQANTLLTNIDTTISSIVGQRAALGAAQNSLDHTLNNLQATSNNLSASNSRIRDVDVAAESAAMSRAQIISQSAVSVLAQANQQPQLALKLLG
jgi:flagellin